MEYEDIICLFYFIVVIQVGVDDDGVIQYLNYDIYNDNGCQFNELIIEIIMLNYFNCYNKDNWNFKCYSAITDTPSNTWMRAPGKHS